MLERMRAEIVSVGTEILLGEILDTNTQYLSARMPAIGLDLYFHSTVGDNQARIVDTVEHALKRSDVVIMTGGLGPTEDDLTREAIAETLGEDMYIDEDALRQLRAFFEARGFAQCPRPHRTRPRERGRAAQPAPASPPLPPAHGHPLRRPHDPPGRGPRPQGWRRLPTRPAVERFRFPAPPSTDTGNGNGETLHHTA